MAVPTHGLCHSDPLLLLQDQEVIAAAQVSIGFLRRSDIPHDKQLSALVCNGCLIFYVVLVIS